MDRAGELGGPREVLPKGRGRGLAIGHAFQTFSRKRSMSR
jgi:hypothetical protein